MAVMPHILLDEKMTAPYALLPGDPARQDSRTSGSGGGAGV